MSEEEMARAEEIHEAANLQLSGLYSRRHAAMNATALHISHRNEITSMIQSVKGSLEILKKAQDCDGMQVPVGLLQLLGWKIIALEDKKGEVTALMEATLREQSRLRIEEMQASAVLTAVNLLRSAELMLG